MTGEEENEQEKAETVVADSYDPVKGKALHSGFLIAQTNSPYTEQGVCSLSRADPDYKQFIPPSGYSFPKRRFGKGPKYVYRSCSPKIFVAFSWAHYSIVNDKLYCDICISAMKKSEWFHYAFK